MGLESFADYVALLNGPSGGDETLQMVSALTTNVTKFFREEHHFRYFADDLMPDLAARARRGERIRIWSAACSEGQEAFSAALVVAKKMPDFQRYDIKILATDIDPTVLTTGRTGRYPLAFLPSIPTEYSKDATDVDGPAGQFEFRADIRRLITFNALNLVGNWPMRGPFDVIFCRNVAIYFDAETQAKIWARFADLLRPDGALFIGHSERIGGPASDSFRSDAITTYRRVLSGENLTRPFITDAGGPT